MPENSDGAMWGRLELGSDEGEFYAPFAFRNTVTDYGQVVRPEAYTAGAPAPFRVDHPSPIGSSDLRAIGIGRIEVNGDEVGLRGKFLDGPFAQEWRSQLQQQIEMGYSPQVSVSMDTGSWEVGDRSDMTPEERNAVNRRGQPARVVIKRADVAHLALVDAPAMPGARVEAALSADADAGEPEAEVVEVDTNAEWRASVAREAKALLLKAALRR